MLLPTFFNIIIIIHLETLYYCACDPLKPQGSRSAGFFCTIMILYLGNGEKASPGDEDQGHGVEPASDVGENPQRKTEPESIKII